MTVSPVSQTRERVRWGEQRREIHGERERNYHIVRTRIELKCGGKENIDNCPPLPIIHMPVELY